MAKPRNVLFIMCDQLRFDYLSCAGHARLHTPNIDALAARGVRFTNTYVQSTICGPSRMSAYTGRYMRSHGSTFNGVPLRVGEPTLGNHLKDIGVRTVLVGKTHMAADREGMARLGIDPASIIGVQTAQCGFEPYERDDGLHPDGRYDPNPAYDGYLRSKGFEAANPWEHWANSAEGPNGELQNGWLLAHADKPARVPDEHSETPYMVRRAIDFMTQAETDGRPWCLHLSLIKPHWPYIVPAPYHAMYGPADVQPAVRSEAERHDPHPVYSAFQQERYSLNFSRDEVRERVIPAYMGLIKQIDDQMGVLLRWLDAKGLTGTTLIVFTSDHGDYLGDHWLGEKYLFHDASAKVPLIICDPDPAADATRGTASDALTEMIDLAPTFLDVFEGTAKPHILEGRSLLPLLRGAQPTQWRDCVFSEYDYAFDFARLRLKTSIRDSRMIMAFDGRWKLIHAEGFPPMLYDLADDPQELVDLGRSGRHQTEINQLLGHIFKWSRQPATRVTMSDAAVMSDDAKFPHYDPNLDPGILIGYWDEAELEAERSKQAAFRR